MTVPELKKLQETVEKHGLLKTYIIDLLYFWTLFFISVSIIVLYDLWFHIDFNSPSYIVIVAAIFTVVTGIDLMLLLKTKVTPTLVVWIIAASPVLVLYKLFKDTDLFKLNKKHTPEAIKKYIFPW